MNTPIRQPFSATQKKEQCGVFSVECSDRVVEKAVIQKAVD